MSLKKYREKRNFKISPEPQGNSKDGQQEKAKSDLIFVVQKHGASQLHYDFRLEYNGTLLSWAVPKGPSLDPSVKRLAMQVEDHPIEYAKFEGVIPKAEYAGCTVVVWDIGTWTQGQSDVEAALKKSDLKFPRHGTKLARQ